MDTASTQQDFGAVKQRLEYIADAVGNEDMPLEEALDLFEEAVALGMKVGDLLEVGLDDAEEAASAGEDGAREGDAAAAEATAN